MNRRRFLKGTGMAIASSMLSRDAAASSFHTGRMVLSMNQNWLWSPSVPPNGHSPEFDDAHFERVAIPHSTTRPSWHSFDDASYQFTSLYRRHFQMPANTEHSRVFVDFEGVMAASTVSINGTQLGQYKGGYTPFTFELTQHINFQGTNVLAVEVDSRERADIPPFGGLIDYMTFGGIYRVVKLRIVPNTFIENIRIKTRNPLANAPSVDVDCYLNRLTDPITLHVTLFDGQRILAFEKAEVNPVGEIGSGSLHTVSLEKILGLILWDIEQPCLYTIVVQILQHGALLDEDTRRVGFREAVFTDHGFELNGRILKLRGLDRHQTFPFVGQAMPARVQRHDALILKNVLHCNIVRTSHYPQSPDFLSACDEIGLLVLEEIPGWQHIGDEAWKDLSLDNLRRMIQRDWNHPSVVLWGVRINESADDHDFYSRTNDLAHELDPTRQTGGIRYIRNSELLEDVFTINDFDWPLSEPSHPLYLNTEFAGHTYPVKQIDDNQKHREHTVRHARVHNQLASSPHYAGGIGWCAFDYNTHRQFGSGDRVCYHGVADIFREVKPAAGFYMSQVDPEQQIVLEPAFHWASGDEPVRFRQAVICSNCDLLKLYIKIEGVWVKSAEALPDRTRFPFLKYPPFSVDLELTHKTFGDLRVEGYWNRSLVITKDFSAAGIDHDLILQLDDEELLANGADSTRLAIRVVDEFGNIRPYANDPISFQLEGPAELIGDNPFALIGGRGALWIRSKESVGRVFVSARHPRLGRRSVHLTIASAPKELV